MIAACSKPKGSTRTEAPAPELLQSIHQFLEDHQGFGTPVSAQALPDWAEGKRQRVKFGNGTILIFYSKDDVVVTVYEDNPQNGRKRIWGDYSPPPEDQLANTQREATGDMPPYTIIRSMNLARGGKQADVMIPSLTRDTPKDERMMIARRIMKKESLSAVSMFSTDEACKAHYSSSFAEAHPDASSGFLGQISPGSDTFIDFN